MQTLVTAPLCLVVCFPLYFYPEGYWLLIITFMHNRRFLQYVTENCPCHIYLGKIVFCLGLFMTSYLMMFLVSVFSVYKRV